MTKLRAQQPRMCNLSDCNQLVKLVSWNTQKSSLPTHTRVLDSDNMKQVAEISQKQCEL